MIRIIALAVCAMAFGSLILFTTLPAMAQKSDTPNAGSSKESPRDSGGRKSFKNDDGDNAPSGGKFDAPTNNKNSTKDAPRQTSPGEPEEQEEQENPDPDQDGVDDDTQNEAVPDKDQTTPENDENPATENEGIDTSIGGKKSWPVDPDQRRDENEDPGEPDTDSENPGRPSIKTLDDGSSIDA